MPTLEAPLIGIDRHRLATDGDGITTLVAFHECPLRCAYCINAQCFKESPECKLTVDKLIERLMPDNIYFWLRVEELLLVVVSHCCTLIL